MKKAVGKKAYLHLPTAETLTSILPFLEPCLLAGGLCPTWCMVWGESRLSLISPLTSRKARVQYIVEGGYGARLGGTGEDRGMRR